jgi:hypothetical protein
VLAASGLFEAQGEPFSRFLMQLPCLGSRKKGREAA